MKKATIARFVIGLAAISAAFGLAACGAETGAPEAEGVGQTSEALSVGSAVAAYTGTAHDLAASCRVTVSSVDKLVQFGGFNSSGNGLDETKIYTPGSPGSWAALDSITDLAGTDNDNQGRGAAQFIKVSATKCLLIGGLSAKSGGTAMLRTYLLDVSQSAGSQWSYAGSLNAGRANFGASMCGSATPPTKAVVFGGRGTTVGSAIDSASSIETWDGATTWTNRDAANPSQVLLPRVAFFGFAAKDAQHFVVAGGYNGNGAQSDVQAFTANNDCTSITKVATGTLKEDDGTTTQARFGSVAFFAPGTDKVIVAGGDSGAALPTHAEQFTVTWTGSPAVTHGTAVTGLTGVRIPSLAFDSASKWILSGGESNDSTTPLAATPVNTIQELKYVASAFAFDSATTLGTARLGAVSEYLPSASKVYVSAGLSAQTNTVLTSTEPVTP